MNDDLGLFDEESAPPPGSSRRERRTKRRITWLGAGVIFAVIVLVAWFGVRQLLGNADYEGNGGTKVLVQVTDGQPQSAIAEELVDKHVVASAGAFTAAAEGNKDMLAVQPGYYVMRSKMSGKAAVNRMTDPAARAGSLQLRPGSRVNDVKKPDGSVDKGLLSRLADASCTKLNGKSTCVSKHQLRGVLSSTDLTSLGVPRWAAEKASKVDKAHRLEGLVLPGVYEVKPGDDAKGLLATVLRDSAAKMSAAGLPSIAEGTGKSPYETLTIASLVQSEGVEQDFGKIARVIHNRLAKHRKLELDSTVNYVLDRPEIRTSAKDRAKAGPYNTYAGTRIPPSPIDSPSREAIKAAAKPDSGDWMFFVKCAKDGSSCFAKTHGEHRKNVKSAQDRGVY